MREDRICLGVVVGAHGLKGQVRIRSFAERPEDLTVYGPLSDKSGARSFHLTLSGRGKGVILANIEGVDRREVAEALKGLELYVARDRLPEPEDEETWYHADLIGLSAIGPDGEPFGRVAALHNYGAGDLIEIAPRGANDAASLVLPFTREVVPEIDLAAGRLTVVMPREIPGQPPDASERPEQEQPGDEP